jgi:hypothetical protein
MVGGSKRRRDIPVFPAYWAVAAVFGRLSGRGVFSSRQGGKISRKWLEKMCC